jgi:hypothetical protein
MDILKYIWEEALILIPMLYILAEIIKKTEKISPNWIPLILLVFSLAFSPLFLGGYTPQNLVQAVLVAGGEMVVYQVVDKTFGGKND